MSIAGFLDDAVAALPDNTATPTTLAVGLGMLVCQCVLWFIFRFIVTSGPWHAEPGYTAHQVVYFPIGVYTAYYGCAHFFSQSPATPAARILVHNEAAHFLCQLQLAILVCWDIPTGIFVKVLREPLMLAHHVGMAVAAWYVATQLNTYYALVFFGVVEVSSVPLTFVDMFHPKHKEYCAWMEKLPFIKSLNDIMRLVFVLLYLVVRGFYFPYIAWLHYAPDMLELIALPLPQRMNITSTQMLIPLALNTPFAFLQLYWGYLLVKQVQKTLGGGLPSTKKGS